MSATPSSPDPPLPAGVAAFFNVSPDLLGVLALDGGIRHANPAWVQALGAADSPGSFLDLAHPEDREALRQLFDTPPQDSMSWVFEGRFRRQDGSYVWLQCNATLAPASGLLHVSARDITERKLVETELRKLAAFPTLNPHAVFEFTDGGQLAYFNDAAAEMARVAGHLHPSHMLPAETPAVVNLCLQTGQSRLRLETQVAGRTYSWSFYPIPSSQAVHCYTSDITEKRQLETQFLRAQRLETVGRLATGIAHDLNNILAPIMMSVNLLQESLSEPRCAPLLETLRASVQRGAEMVKQILSFTRGQGGTPSEVHLRLLLTELARIIGETFPRSIRIQTNAPKDLWPVRADPTQMHQILMNLCVNARDAMPEGGHLLLEVQNRVLASGAPELPPDAKPAQYVLLTVADSGVGMSKEIQSRIWEPFFTLKPAGQGTGLGLSTVLSIVKAHDGFVRVESQPGQGSRFQVFLPAVHPASQAIVIEPEVPFGLGRGELILVVDDEHAFQEITRAIFLRHGYRVLTASDGREGLEIFARHKHEIDLIMTDMVMPTLDGAAMIRRARELSPEVAVLAVTGLGENDQAKGLNVPFLLKPFSTERLLRAVHELLASRQRVAA